MADPDLDPAYPSPDEAGGGGRPDWRPQPDRDRAPGTGGGTAGGNAPNMPNRPGTYTGQAVRLGGFVWEWSAQSGRTGWQKMRAVKPSDKDRIPPAGVALDEGFDLEKWRQRQARGGGGGSGGGSGDGGGGGGGGADRDTSNPGTTPSEPDSSGGGGGGSREKLAGVPDGGKIWKVGDDYYLIYEVPDSITDGGEPVRLYYEFRNEKEARAVSIGAGINIDRTIPKNRWDKVVRNQNLVDAGRVEHIQNTDEHPFSQWVADFDLEAEFQPWLRDRDYLELIAESILEGRSPTDAELANTNFSRTHSKEEVDALIRFHNDRTGWNRDLEANKTAVRQALTAAGYDPEAPGHSRVARHFARELMFGRITDPDTLALEVERAFNPYHSQALLTAGFEGLPEGAEVVRHKGRQYVRLDGKDYALAHGLERAQFGSADARKVDEVNDEGAFRDFLAGGRAGKPQGRDSVEGVEATRELVHTWLGPLLASEWTESKIAQWAQRISENPDAENELVSKLRGIRAAAYKGYDPELTYDDIATVGRSLFAQVWGQTPDEKSDEFQKILQMNDVGQAQAYLREVGLEKGVRQVVDEGLSGLARQFDSGVYRSAV